MADDVTERIKQLKAELDSLEREKAKETIRRTPRAAQPIPTPKTKTPRAKGHGFNAFWQFVIICLTFVTLYLKISNELKIPPEYLIPCLIDAYKNFPLALLA